jgi:6,7-dimethyl-8-ribityllumazine synthase
MIRSIVFPRVLGKSLEDLQPALELFRALGFAAGNEWHEGGSHGLEMLAPSGGVEFIAAADAPAVDAMIEVSDADQAYEMVKKLVENPHPSKPGLDGVPVLSIRKEISDTAYGARLFEVEVSGLRLGFLTYARKPAETRGLEGGLTAGKKRFAIVVARFNSFITERLLDGALQALRQCGAASDAVQIAHVPGSFEIPAAARQLAQSGKFDAVICIGCLLRGGTLHYEVIANEVARGVGQSAQETGVPHSFGVLTCDTLEQAIDRAGLKAGNKGFEAAMAAVEMATLRDRMPKKRRSGQKKALSSGEGAAAGVETAGRSARDEALARDDKSGEGRSTRADNSMIGRDDKSGKSEAAQAVKDGAQ